MLEIGSLIDGKYRILRVVGKGGMSVVYQAVNEKANKIWAIKEVRKDGVQNFEVVKQNLVVETDLLKRLNHPNLPSIIDVIDTDDCFLIVMDYIEGNSLSSALEHSGAQSQDDVVEWSKQLCDVLGYLHSRRPPIIYRDMKPANVMLKPDGDVSLIDFGTAREFKSSAVEDTTCLGTQGYAAPEQYGGHGQTDARTDIYCLGTTMYHLITGHNPSKPPYEMYPIRQWNPMLSSGLEEIIIKCTQRNPNDRYQNCAELLYALEHYQDLDIENKKEQNLKWKVFLSSCIVAIVCLVLSLGFKVGASLASGSTYDSYIASASTADAEEANSHYISAIGYDPSRPEAYVGLISSLMTDNNITASEYDVIKKNLTTDNLNKLKSGDPSAYTDDVCYELGNDLMVCYESEDTSIDNKTRMLKAEPWFAKAVESSDENIRNKATQRQALCSIATEGDKKNGEVGGNYGNYFLQLQNICDDSITTDSNILFALNTLNFVASEIYTKGSDMIGSTTDEGTQITKKDVKSLIDTINNDVAAIKANPNFAKYSQEYPKCNDVINSINNNIKGANDTFFDTNKPGEEN